VGYLFQFSKLEVRDTASFPPVRHPIAGTARAERQLRDRLAARTIAMQEKCNGIALARSIS
jgi:hypothetical protein